jgi:hypothetical protein
MSQTQPGADELVREGGAALRGGDRERARRLLAQAVRAEPRNEQAWLLLAGAVTDPEQRRSCLERVLRLNPEHQIARRALAVEERRPTTDDRRTTEDERRPAASERRTTEDERRLAAMSTQPAPASAQPAPAAGSLLDRLKTPAALAPASNALQPAPAEPRSVLELLREGSALAPGSGPAPEPVLPAALALPRPEPAAQRLPPNQGLIELSAAGLQRRRQERQLWMAVLAIGLVMMLAGVSLAGIVLLAG